LRSIRNHEALTDGCGKSEEPIITATVNYERWLKKHVAVVETDLQLKHKEMATSLFAFLIRGLELSRPIASAVIAAIMIACILVLPHRAGRHPEQAAMPR
jgi:hypothetical protein